MALQNPSFVGTGQAATLGYLLEVSSLQLSRFQAVDVPKLFYRDGFWGEHLQRDYMALPEKALGSSGEAWLLCEVTGM